MCAVAVAGEPSSMGIRGSIVMLVAILCISLPSVPPWPLLSHRSSTPSRSNYSRTKAASATNERLVLKRFGPQKASETESRRKREGRRISSTRLLLSFPQPFSGWIVIFVIPRTAFRFGNGGSDGRVRAKDVCGTTDNKLFFRVRVVCLLDALV